MKTLIDNSTGMVGAVPTYDGGLRDWPRWAPCAAVAWSLIYALLGIYWALSGHGFPYTLENISDGMGPLLGRFGPGVAWFVVMIAGIPAAATGTAMLFGVRSKRLRPLLITAGVLLAASLLLLMTGLTLLISVGYIPYAVMVLISGVEFGQVYLESLVHWAILHQLLCLIGGFFWLAATVSYTRRSGGREGWTSPNN